MTDTTKDDLDVVQLEQLVLEDTKLAEDEERIKARRATIRSVLARHLDAGTTDLADHKVIVSMPSRLDAKALGEAFPVAQHPELYKPALDTTAVRHHLSPAVLEQYTRAGSTTVTIR
ncbi:hypothetical protein G8C93_00915 [Cellulosimicrobium cellulans]|uniref:hypothetical protein n=1 Tax=Cellulosimicrobium cellulans TaxID=1710 RepID=UPI001884301A|nr:hypothetical protein [Cellulosimicrobium cellulans]MBE9924453.1 hypothetical protein [Cellulosimicrobium cellulans]